MPQKPSFNTPDQYPTLSDVDQLEFLGDETLPDGKTVLERFHDPARAYYVDLDRTKGQFRWYAEEHKELAWRNFSGGGMHELRAYQYEPGYVLARLKPMRDVWQSARNGKGKARDLRMILEEHQRNFDHWEAEAKKPGANITHNFRSELYEMKAHLKAATARVKWMEEQEADAPGNSAKTEGSI